MQSEKLYVFSSELESPLNNENLADWNQDRKIRTVKELRIALAVRKEIPTFQQMIARTRCTLLATGSPYSTKSLAHETKVTLIMWLLLRSLALSSSLLLLRLL